MKRGPAFGTLCFSAALTDTVVRLMQIGRAHPKVPIMLRRFLEGVFSFPIGSALFGIFFGIGCAVALRPRQRIGLTEIVSATVFCVAASIICTFAAGFISQLLLSEHEQLQPFLPTFMFVFCLAIIARVALSLEIHPAAMLLVAIVGTVLRVPQVQAAFPMGIGNYWYTWLGATIAVVSLKSFR